MDTVVLDGIKYVKAVTAAKQFRYTSDYIGQLCRAKKVDARLVGRTWFVNIDSITTHRRNKNKSKKTTEVVSDDKVAVDRASSIPIKVAPVMQNRTIKMVTEPMRSSSKARRLKVLYELDDEALIPSITRKKTRPPKTIRIEPAGAKKIKISGKKLAAEFKPSKLPDVALSGALEVTTLSDKELSAAKPVPATDASTEENLLENDQQNKAKPPKEESVAEVQKQKKTVSKNLETAQKSKTETTSELVTKVNKETIPSPIRPTEMQKILKNTISPEETVPSLVKPQPAEPVSVFVLVSPLIATFIALVCVIIIFSASTKVTILESIYESEIIFQTANLLEFFTPN